VPAIARAVVIPRGVLLAAAIALIFGVYPAIRAARIDPAVALRAD
jgi:ABC-type antimicrobial peptide transport system permease subunit